MLKNNLPKIRSFLLVSVVFYSGWWGIVFSASQNHPLLPIGIAAVGVLANVLFTGFSVREWLWILTGLVLGFAFDSIIQSFGLLTFSHQFHPLLAPLWVGALWAHFCSSFLTLKGIKSPFVQFLFGAIGGPLSYFVGTKFDLIVYAEPLWLFIGLHALLWGLFFPLLLRVHQMIHPSERSPFLSEG